MMHAKQHIHACCYMEQAEHGGIKHRTKTRMRDLRSEEHRSSAASRKQEPLYSDAVPLPSGVCSVRNALFRPSSFRATHGMQLNATQRMPGCWPGLVAAPAAALEAAPH
jgi:hypothetical protein